MEFRKLAPVCLVLPLLVGFDEVELKTYPRSRPDLHIVDEAVARGATSCRFNLEDLVIHAIGDRQIDGLATYPVGAEQTRPSMGTYVTTYPNGDQSHLQWVAGPDASGLCTLYWSESRYWKQSCPEVLAGYDRDEWTGPQPVGASTLLVGVQEKGNGLRVLATPVGSGCMVTESEVAWRIDPDREAREWIKADHGYDPGETSPDISEPASHDRERP